MRKRLPPTKPFSGPRFSKYCFRSEEHTSELQSLRHLVCRLLLEKMRQPPSSTLFPYTTLFRSLARGCKQCGNDYLRPSHSPARDSQNTVSDRKSTRLNSSHLGISYAVFCLKRCGNHRVLHSFPTRRSSDLWHVDVSNAETITSDQAILRPEILKILF